MVKLNEKKIRWIISKSNQGWSSKRIALAQKVSSSRIRQIIGAYKKTGKIPSINKPGRKSKTIHPEIINTVLQAHKETNLGPLALEKKIEKERKLHIPHNTIYKIMKEFKLIKPNPNKKKQRKYVRWERKHSNSLWQGDWKQINKSKWLIAFMDDASRMITCYGVFNNPTKENAIKVLKQGFNKWGKPKQVLTDHGSQFYANKKDKKGNGKSEFTEFLESEGVEHILARVKHPQTNGKIERWFGLLEQKYYLFDYDIDKFVKWYNEIKPHMSLWFDYAETPKEAFYRKLRPEVLIGMFFGSK